MTRPRDRKDFDSNKPAMGYADYLLQDQLRHKAKYGTVPRLMPGMKLRVSKDGKATVTGIPGWKE